MNKTQQGTLSQPTGVNTSTEKYNISRSAIKNSRDIFDRYAADNDGKISMTNLKLALGDIFYRENGFRPTDNEYLQLMKTYEFKEDHQSSFREFKRMLKHLGGYKVYDGQSIATERKSKMDHYTEIPNLKAVPVSMQKDATINSTNRRSNAVFAQEGHEPNSLEKRNEQVYQQGLENPTKVKTDILGTTKEEFKPQQNSQIQMYPLMPQTIKISNTIFKNFEKNNNGRIQAEDIPLTINQVYSLEGKQAPPYDYINQIVQKYQFQQNHSITSREFKRILKEMSGLKKYDATTISLQKYTLNPGPYPGDPNYVDPYFRVEKQPLTGQLPALNPNFVEKKYGLTHNGFHYAKTIFGNRKVNVNGHVDMDILQTAINDVYAVDNQTPPTQDDIIYVLRKQNIPLNRPMTYKEFRRLLKELSGTKEYEKGTFGFLRKLFK
jgi:Ca2+-binding EF-hand superfamily protein